MSAGFPYMSARIQSMSVPVRSVDAAAGGWAGGEARGRAGMGVVSRGGARGRGAFLPRRLTCTIRRCDASPGLGSCF